MLAEAETLDQKSIEIHISTPEEFNYHECLVFLARSDEERLHFIQNEKIRKLLKVGDKFILFEVSNPTPGHLQIEPLNCIPSKPDREFVKNFISDWFDLATDLKPFYKLARTEKLLNQLVKNHFGLRLIKIDDLFQALCWAILGQQINIRFAYTLYRRFIEAFGEKLDFNGQKYWLFPKPEVISEISVNDLMRLQMTGRKSEYIIGLAQQMARGEISKEKLLAYRNFEKARDKLLSIRGVGSWTANYVMMRCLGDRNAFPIEDIGLHNAIKNQLNLKEKPSIGEIEKLSAGWNGWQAYITFYLYRSLL